MVMVERLMDREGWASPADAAPHLRHKGARVTSPKRCLCGYGVLRGP
jgi:hypothetical protein